MTVLKASFLTPLLLVSALSGCAVMNAQVKGAGEVLFPVVNASVRNFGRAIDPWLRALALKADAPAAFASSLSA